MNIIWSEHKILELPPQIQAAWNGTRGMKIEVYREYQVNGNKRKGGTAIFTWNKAENKVNIRVIHTGYFLLVIGRNLEKI